jgi:EAL domain-containing protein (putative c-di-GMP-specific phosphodiesterase class I)/GGDEF domain-containing protein
MYVSTTAKLGPGGETLGGVVYARELRRHEPVPGSLEFDEMSGLLTRAAFHNRASTAVVDSFRDNDMCALLLAEVEGVVPPNEAAVIRSLGGRLSRITRSIDLVAYLGDNQFAVLLRGVGSEAEALRIADTAAQSLVGTPVPTTAGDVMVSATCGVAMVRPGDGLEGLLERARAGATHVPPHPAPLVVAQQAIAGSEALTVEQVGLGMSHGDVLPYVQPLVELASGETVGYRAFARWRHPTLGLLEPERFVDLVAETELATVIDLYVAREAVATLLLMTRDKPLRLYTPIGRRMIADLRTEQNLAEIADAFFVAPSQIHLQVARHLLDTWTPALHDALYTLRADGLRVVLTDVEQVGEIDAVVDVLDELELSPRLIAAAVSDESARAELIDTVRWARARGLGVVAAGVSRPEHPGLLLDAGCPVAYGPFLAEPELASAAG